MYTVFNSKRLPPKVFVQTENDLYRSKMINCVTLIYHLHKHLCTSADSKATFLETRRPWPRGYTLFFMLNSAELEIYTAHKC